MFVDLFAFSGIILSLFLLLLLFQKKKKLQSDFLLGFWLLGMAFHFLYFYLSFHQLLDENIALQVLGNSLPVFHAPIISTYAYSLDRGFISIKLIIIYLIPIPFYLIINAILFANNWIHSEGFLTIINQNTPF